MITKTKKGFTLIELMVVIAIIGILATAGITQFSQYQARSRDTVRITNVGAVKTMLGIFYSDNGTYPQPKTNGCLSDINGKVADNFQEYVGAKAPLDPQVGNESKPCTVKRSMGYKLLSRNAVPESAYVITTNTETKNKSNVKWSTLQSDTTAEAAEGKIGKAITGNNLNASDIIYAEVN